VVSGDAVWLKRVLGLPEPAESLCGACYRLPLAPAIAARAEHSPLDLGALGRRWKELRASGRFILVEGIGGVLVPLRGRVTVADLVGRMGIPAVVVAPAGLGTINHTLLTVEALRARRVRVAGVVLNGARGRDMAERTNAGAIRKLAGVPVFAVLPWIRGIRRDPAALRRLARRLPVRAIMRACGRVR
jgi:dethiobiotin synthetase